jgi:hypothetical protein
LIHGFGSMPDTAYHDGQYFYNWQKELFVVCVSTVLKYVVLIVVLVDVFVIYFGRSRVKLLLDRTRIHQILSKSF